MKYCPECGEKIDTKSKRIDNEKPFKKTDKRGLIISAGILLIIAASLCVVLGISAILDAEHDSNRDYYDYGYDDYYSYKWVNIEMKYFIGVASFSAFTIGLISALLIFKKTCFKIVLLGFFNVNIASLLSIGNHIGMFLAFGLPIFVLSLLSMIFIIHSKNVFE